MPLYCKSVFLQPHHPPAPLHPPHTRAPVTPVPSHLLHPLPLSRNGPPPACTPPTPTPHSALHTHMHPSPPTFFRPLPLSRKGPQPACIRSSLPSPQWFSDFLCSAARLRVIVSELAEPSTFRRDTAAKSGPTFYVFKNKIRKLHPTPLVESSNKDMGPRYDESR